MRFVPLPELVIVMVFGSVTRSPTRRRAAFWTLLAGIVLVIYFFR
jgi:hypothetical protein